MKKIFVLLLFISVKSLAQNTFPTSGNVGIGLASPSTLLHLRGDHANSKMRLTFPASLNGGNTGEINMLTWVSEPYHTWEGGGIGMNVDNVQNFPRLNTTIGQSYIRFQPNGGLMKFVTGNNAGEVFETLNLLNGNVGIGTNNPLSKLTIENSFTPSYMQLAIKNVTAGEGIGISFNETNNTRRGHIYAANGNGLILGDETGYGLRVFSGGSEVLTARSNGNVGLGTTNPIQKLEIGGGRPMTFNSSSGAIKMKGDAGGWAMNYGFLGNNGTDHGGFWGYGGANDLNQWSIGKNYTDNFFVVRSDGRVGIGTNVPTAQFDVFGLNAANFGTIGQCCAPAYTIGVSEATNSNSRLPSIQFHAAGYNEAFLRLASDARVIEIGDHQSVGVDFAIRNAANNVRNVLISGKSNSFFNGGNVGIGTSAPVALLEVGTNESIASPRMKILGHSDTLPLTEWGDGGVVSTKIIRTSQNIMKMVTSNYAGSFSFVGNYDFNGKLGIGTANIPADYKLAVDGNIIAEKVKVKNSNAWPDYVFNNDYQLPSLSEIEKYVNENSHLPDIPSAAEVEKEGQDLGEMNRLLLKKVEELTLYLIEQEKRIITLEKQVRK